MNYRMAGIIKRISYVASILLALASMLKEELRVWLLLAACAVLIAGVVIQSVFYRCPHCGTLLPANSPLPEECPKCRTKLK